MSPDAQTPPIELNSPAAALPEARAWRKKRPHGSEVELEKYLRDEEQFDDVVAREIAAEVFAEKPSAAQPANGQVSVQSGTKKSSAQDANGHSTDQKLATGPGAKRSSCSFEAAVNKLYELWRQDPGLMNSGSKAELCKQFLAAGCTPEMFETAYTHAKSEQAKAQAAAAASSTNGTGAGSLSSTQKNAQEAQGYANRLAQYVTEKKGKYLTDELGDFSVLLEEKRIALNFEIDNRELNALLLKVCSITLHDHLAKLTIERLIDVAYKAAGEFKLRKFSALSRDKTRLYFPLKDSGKLLCMATDRITMVPNGTNEDALWVEYPEQFHEATPFEYMEDELAEGLNEYEQLIVNNLPTRVPAMAEFVATNEVLFSLVREICDKRFTTHHRGQTGDSKTGAAELTVRECLGLPIHGSATEASLSRLGDCGVLVMDNWEQADMTAGRVSFLLHLSTGAERLRCSGDGIRVSNQYRPVGVLTAIESPTRSELENRFVTVDFNATERDRAHFNQEQVYEEIRRKRNSILSALMKVLQRFIHNWQRRHQEPAIAVPKSIDRFAEHYRTLVRLLRAYGEVAGKPTGWADKISAQWKETLDTRDEDGSNALGFKVERFLARVAKEARIEADEMETNSIPKPNQFLEEYVIDWHVPHTHQGQKGLVTITTASRLLAWLQETYRYDKSYPQDPRSLGQRLGELKSSVFRILTEKDAPALLKRKKGQRFLGLFELSDES